MLSCWKKERKRRKEKMKEEKKEGRKEGRQIDQDGLVIRSTC